MTTRRTIRTSQTTDQMIDWIIKTVKQRSNKLITKETAKIIYDGIFARAFEEAATQGSFKLPYGWGSFYLRIIGQDAKPRRTPGGEVVERKPKAVIRYKPGTAVRQLLNGEPRRKPGRPAGDNAPETSAV